MWSRSDLKTRAKNVLKTCYWNAVLVGFILLVLGGKAGVSFGIPQGNITTLMNNPKEFVEDFADDMDIYGDAGELAEDVKNSVSEVFFGKNMGAFFWLFNIVMGVASIFMLLAIAFKILVTAPIQIGANRFFMISRQDKTSVGELGYAFKSGRYGNIVKTEFLRSLYTYLWSLLFVVPGIIKSYEYRMIPYILSENPEMNYKEAFHLSKEMMDGEKWNTFVLDLSFIGWYLLSVCCTCNILSIFYVVPYVELTNAELYAILREKVLAAGITNTYELRGYDFD